MSLRQRFRRQLGPLTRASVLRKAVEDVGSANGRVKVPAEFTPRDYAIFLLHIAAGIEHALMVEYLYAAFSLGGPNVPLERRREVQRWQEIVLGIAKEEMGHLLTVQNLLRCLGGPPNFDREDYPWDSGFYPFPFRLEPLTLAALAKYVFVESPLDWSGKEADEVRALALQGESSSDLHRVGELYDLLYRLLRDEQLLANEDFRGATYPFQSNWDEWGRGYKGGARGNSVGPASEHTPDVILMRVTSRSDALNAVRAVAKQGEATPTADETAPSHFARFLQIYRHFPRDGWSPAREVPVDPVVVSDDSDGDGWSGTLITHETARLWAQLFNVRYRMLLTNITHSFDYPSNVAASAASTPRGFLVNAAFGEMYALHTIANILVQTPLNAECDGQMAGPPFQMPYTLRMPLEQADRWRRHIDLAAASISLCERISGHCTGDQGEYLRALQVMDSKAINTIQMILQGTAEPSIA